MGENGVFAAIIAGDTFKYYSEGEWKVSTSGKYVPIINPTTRNTQFKVQGIRAVAKLPALRFIYCLLIYVIRFILSTGYPMFSCFSHPGIEISSKF